MKARLLILCLMLAVVFSGGVAAQDKVPEITMAIMTFGPAPSDLQSVTDEINKVIVPKIGAKAKFLCINIGAWSQQTNLMLASGESLDLLLNGTLPIMTYSTQVAKNQLLPLDDLLAKYGQGIAASMDKGFLAAGKVNGKTYLVPQVRDLAGEYVYVMRKDIVDELGIDVSKIKSYADIEKVLQLVKQKKPDLVPLIPQTAGPSVADGMTDCDYAGPEHMGILSDYGKALKVVNQYEDPGMVAKIKLINSWYKQGLILKDAATNKDDFTVYFKANKAFSYLAEGKPGFADQQSAMAGMPLIAVKMATAYSTTNQVLKFGWTVPRASRAPDKAMQFLNLLYTDPVVYNLLCYGIEGRHYVKLADGRIDYAPGVTPGQAAYDFGGMNWMFGNQFLSFLRVPNPLNLWEQMKTFNNSAMKSKALGFTFDITSVKNEIAACTNVLNQYRLGLEDGVLDPDKYLPEFNQKLKAAGLDRIMAEKQKQLDAWARANGVK